MISHWLLCCSKTLFSVNSLFHVLRQVHRLTSSCHLLSAICLSSGLDRKLLLKRLPQIPTSYFTSDFHHSLAGDVIHVWQYPVLLTPAFARSLRTLVSHTNVFDHQGMTHKCSEVNTAAVNTMSAIFLCSLTLSQPFLINPEFRLCHQPFIPAMTFQWFRSSLVIKSKLLPRH